MPDNEDDVRRETLFVLPCHCHSRLDAFLREFYKTNSRTYFQKLIEEGLVLVNGHPVKKSYRPEVDDEIEVQLALTKELDLIAEDIPLDILYEDDDMLAINKPAGMVVHPGHGNTSHTFANALLFYCKTLERNDPIRPGIVHRIDKGTSGVLLAAKTTRMHQALSRLFATRKIEKSYLAVCLGILSKSGTISAPIGRHPVYRKQMAVLQEGGKDALSHYAPLSHGKNMTLVRVQIETGRTHQIRVHLKHIGFPILGDSIYGSEAYNKHLHLTRQLLHCEKLAFIHPLTGQHIEIAAPLSQDISDILSKNGISYESSSATSNQSPSNSSRSDDKLN